MVEAGFFKGQIARNGTDRFVSTREKLIAVRVGVLALVREFDKSAWPASAAPSAGDASAKAGKPLSSKVPEGWRPRTRRRPRMANQTAPNLHGASLCWGREDPPRRTLLVFQRGAVGEGCGGINPLRRVACWRKPHSSGGL